MVAFPMQKMQAECFIRPFRLNVLPRSATRVYCHWKVYDMVLFTETKSNLCICAVNCMSTKLHCMSAVQHSYVPGCPGMSLHRHVNPKNMKDFPLQNFQADFFDKTFSLNISSFVS